MSQGCKLCMKEKHKLILSNQKDLNKDNCFGLALNVYSWKTKAFLKPDLSLFPLPRFFPLHKFYTNSEFCPSHVCQVELKIPSNLPRRHCLTESRAWLQHVSAGFQYELQHSFTLTQLTRICSSESGCFRKKTTTLLLL